MSIRPRNTAARTTAPTTRGRPSLRRHGAALAALAMCAATVTALTTDGSAAAGAASGTAARTADRIETVASTQQAPATKPTRRHRKNLSISVLSGRADLVSGGSALVKVNFSHRTNPRKVKVILGHRDVTQAFARRAHGRFEGLVTDLPVGRNTLKARVGRAGARITLVNHPNGGPVLSGPQIQPWTCQAGAVDTQCNQPSTLTYQYMSTNPTKNGFQPYDPQNPPSDVKKTTVRKGVTVPFIVRTETGYMDRDQYTVTALYQPDKPWTAVVPQVQFNHHLLITHGSSCGDDRTTGTAPDTTGTATTDLALRYGWAVMSTALDNSGHNCNLAVQAESLIMAKEHVVKTYGTLGYTIGTGCSGGSLAEQWIANAYPGVYQGILPSCSFPDAYSTATQFLDYHLLLGYLTDPTKWDVASGVVWAPNQIGDVLGGPDGLMNAEVSEQAQFHVAIPTDACAGTTAANRYDATTNPDGVRCTIQDAAVNVFGPEEKRLWTDAEKAAGHGFVRLPVDNVGVQYGLSALLAKSITPAQFVDLNDKVGGVDVDAGSTAARVDSAGAASLGRAYRTGMINEANHLDQVPIIDCRGTNPGIFHDTYRAFAIRARLDREHGTHANQVIWEGPVPLTADKDCEVNSFVQMNSWLRNIQRDHASGSLPAKVIRNKPQGLGDACFSGAGQKVSDTLCPAAVVPIEATPRMVAGDAITTDTNKCQLTGLDRNGYGGVAFSDAQWRKLKSIFTAGVCDFSQPGVDQQPTVPWLTYQDRRGNVVYGGRPLGAAPISRRLR